VKLCLRLSTCLYSSCVLMLISSHMNVLLLCGSMEGARINVEMSVIFGNDSWFWVLRLTVCNVLDVVSRWQWNSGFLLAGFIYFVLLVHWLFDGYTRPRAAMWVIVLGWVIEPLWRNISEESVFIWWKMLHFPFEYDLWRAAVASKWRSDTLFIWFR
jgi:hypothetical protein